MAEKPEQLTLLDFIDWCLRNIDTDKLAALMTDYGYDRYDSETIAEALNNSEFYDAFGLLLRSSLNEEKSYSEQMRAQGEITAADWLKISKSRTFAKATGTTATTAPGTLEIIGGLLAGVGTALGSLFGNKTTTTTAPVTAPATTGSSTFLWIILAVVILAVIVILVMSTARKR